MFPNLSELPILVNLLLDTDTDTKESHKIVSDVHQKL